jgi:hypothetical protein
MSTTTVIDRCDIAAHRTWQHHRVSPAYMRGIPSWVWQSALARGAMRRRAASAIT